MQAAEETNATEETGRKIVLTESDKLRFWKRVNKSGPTPDQNNPFYKGLGPCWLWTGIVSKRGYGQLTIGRGNILAHRLSWIIHHGDIPEGAGYHGTCVLHKCDVNNCVRNSHLFLGTVQDNNEDKARKGRSNAPSGERHGSVTHPERLARGDANGSRIHIERMPRGTKHWNVKLAESDVVEIRKLYAAGGTSYSILGREFGVCWEMIRCIVKRYSWKHI